MDLELIGELSAKLGERRGLDFRTSSILTIFGDVNHHAGSASQMLRATFRLAAKSARQTRPTGCQLVKPRISDSTDNIFRSQSLEPSFCRPETEVTLQVPVPLRLRTP